MQPSVIIRTRVEFIHRYKNAPEAVRFLRDYHRHELHVELEMTTTELDRELEFIMVKRELDCYLQTECELSYVDKSCETVATEVAAWAKKKYGERQIIVTIMEDGENGGRVSC